MARAVPEGSSRVGGPPDRLLGAAIADDLGFLIAAARARTAIEANSVLAPLGLKVREFSLLWVVSEDLRPSQRELAEFLALDPSQVVSILDDLERRRLVVREQDARDRRSRIIVATDRGRDLIEQALLEVRSASERTLGDLDASEQSMLRDLLSRVAFRGSVGR
jgi:DNA-binding MarR family transcriptional regulator